MLYTAPEAQADACLAFRNHILPNGDVTSKGAKFVEKEQRYHVEVQVRYSDGSSQMGTVYIGEERGYAICIHTVLHADNSSGFPHSWQHGWLH